MKQQRYTDEFRREAIRHSCLTRWAPHMAPYTLGYLAGHSDMNVTKRYIHPDDETVKAAFDRAKNLPNLPASPPSSPPTLKTTASRGSKKKL